MSGKSRLGPTAQVVVILKTNQGGEWIIPQIEKLLERGEEVVAIIPDGRGKLRKLMDELAGATPTFSIWPTKYQFNFGPNLSTLKGLYEVRRIIRASHARVIFYHLYASALVSRLASLGLGVRRVHMVAGPLYLENRIIRIVERFLVRLDHHLIAGSRFTYGLYRQLKMPEHRMSVVSYGVDLEYFDADNVEADGALRKGLPDPQSGFVVIMVAYFYAPKNLVYAAVGIKGHEVALDAWKQFSQGNPNVRMVFVGSGFGPNGDTYRARVKARATDLGIADSVTWVETVEDVRSAYKAADLSIAPSLSENHGSVLEASAMGVPSIVSSAGALSETVTPETGWVFQSEDAHELAAKLSEAHHQFLTEGLAQKATAARQLMLDKFDIKNSVYGVYQAISKQQAENQ